MEEDTCFLCSNAICDDSPYAAVTTKGLAGIINASKQRDDKIHELFNPMPTGAIKVHTECRRVYTNPIKIKSDIKLRTSQDGIPSTTSRTLRGSVGSFNFKENCLFCSKIITDYEKRNKKTVFPVRTFQFRETVLKVCSTRSDLWAANVHARMLSVIDLPAVEARYHQVCSVNFRRGKPIPVKYTPEDIGGLPTVVGRPVDTDSSDAFVKTCEWLQENCQEPISVSDLVEKMRSFLPEESEPYSSRHLKKKLHDWFGDNIIISGTDGKCNMITFGKTVSNIILDYHKQKRLDDPDEEKFRLIESAAKLIRTEINLLYKNKDFYPSASDIASVEENKTYLPPVLLTFLDILIGGKRNDLKQVSIGQAIMQACRPRSLICPIPLAVGVQIHRDFGSRFLIDEIFNLGFSVSYDEVQKYIHSSVMDERNQCVVPSGHFSQWVADNVDHNIATIDGHNTFHGMGVIMCASGAYSNTSSLLTGKIKRLKSRPLAHDIIKKAKIPLHYIQSPSSTAMNKLKFQKLFYEPIQTNLLDVLWSTSKLFKTPQPGWLGYMQTAIEGEHSGVTVTSFLPMIDLNPTSYSCVYTTLMFICNEAKRLNVETPIVTFDQCLWIKAMEVICIDHKGEFDNLVIRLGGFHTLMSFLGAIGGLMAGSGLEEALQTVYAENSVPHMLKGKAYSRALRGHFLISSALTALIVADVLKCSLPFEVTADSDLNEIASESECITSDAMDVETSDGDLNLENFIHLFKNVLSGDIKAEEVISNSDLHKLSSLIDERKNLFKSQSRTAKLWLLYLNMVDIAKTFISAERSGNFEMHLQAVEHMLPFFASSGHNNYAKCARMYLQQMRELKTTNPEIYKMLNKGHFTVRRKDKKWSGVWTDMYIEQTLMKCTKSRSGITHGGGMTESQRATWILSHSRCCEVTCAMSLLTSVSRIGSEQHTDLTDARMARDLEDMKKIMQFFIDHNPFTASPRSLWNIFNGLTDSKNIVTVENADIIGRQIQEKLTGKLFKEETLLKSDQAVTMKVLKKGIIIAGETHHLDSRLLTQKILACISLDSIAKDASEFFNYELSTLPTALFDHSTQQMRKTDKSSLANTLDNMNVNKIQHSQQCTSYVLDGGALIHQLPWSSSATFGDIIRQHESYVNKRYGKVTIVFDGYENPNIKDMEHRLRMKQSSVEVVFDKNSPVIVKKNKFLSNSKNKQRFINILGSYFQERGHSVVHAEGDADTLIVKEALNISQEKPVTVVADDTDILILLLYHSSKNIVMQSATRSDKVRDIQAMQRSIGEEACKTLLFVHALTGCDTTSALFGKSKSSAFKSITKSKKLCEWASHFGSSEDITTKDYLIDIGCKFIESLYGSNSEGSKLNILRYELYIRKIASAEKEFDIARLPPTENAAKYHLLRVHLQCFIWKNLNMPSPDPTLWGWQLVEGEFQPILTDLSPAPDKLLNLIKCACKTTIEEPCNSMKCSCRRYGLQCSIICKNCCGKDCTNTGDNFVLDDDENYT